jgi:ABC-type antimicrobial peptide transport system permease subunit
MNVSVRGLLPIGVAMRDVSVLQGRIFEPGLRQVVVGEAIAKRYPDARIGKRVRFGRGSWEVVGVFRVGESAANSEIWVDLNQLRGDFETHGGSSSLLVRTENGATKAQLVKTISDDQRLGSSAIGEKEYYAKLTASGAPLQVLGFSVAVIMAIGSAFAATNTMYAAVARRSREIGTRRWASAGGRSSGR